MKTSQEELSELLTQYATRVVKLARTVSVMTNGKDVDYATGLKIINDEYIEKLCRVMLKHDVKILVEQ